MALVRREASAAPIYVFYDGETLADSSEVRLPSGGEGWLAGFQQSLTDLQVGSGPFVGAPDGEGCDDARPRPLPEPDRVFRLEGTGWRSEPALPGGLVDDLRVPALDVNRCFESGRGVAPDLATCVDMPKVRPPEPPLAVEQPRRPVGCRACLDYRELPVCGEFERLDFSEETCVPIARPCPDGDFRAAPAMGSVVYVDASAAPGGDGSLGAPLRTLEEALETGGPHIWLGAGTYGGVEESRLRDVWLEGACPASTRITGDVYLAGTSTLAGVTVEGEVRALLGAKAFLREAKVEGRIAGAGELDTWSVRVLDGLTAWPAASLRLTAFDLDGAGPAVGVQGQVRLRDGVVRSADQSGTVVVPVTGSIDMQRVLLQTAWRGISVLGGRATLQDVVLLGGTDDALHVEQAGHLEATRVLIRGPEVGAALGARSTMKLEDIRLEGTARTRYGIEVVDAKLETLRVELRSTDLAGLHAEGRDTDLWLEDLRIVDVGMDGAGIVVRHGQVRGERISMFTMWGEGLILSGEVWAELSDVAIDLVAKAGILLGNLFDELPTGILRRVWVTDAVSTAITTSRLGIELEDVRIERAQIGLDVSPGPGLPEAEPLKARRIAISDTDVALFMGNFAPQRQAALLLEDARLTQNASGISLRRCWPEQGAFFSAMSMEGVDVPVQFLED